MELGEPTHLISSCAGRAVQTANHIAKILGIMEIIPSSEITQDHPEQERDKEINAILCGALRRHDVPCSNVGSIIAVTHAPFVGMALEQMGIEYSEVTLNPGSITEYIPNPKNK